MQEVGFVEIDSAWKVSKYGLFTTYLSVFSPNAGKYGPEKPRTWTHFTQWETAFYNEVLLQTSAKSYLFP